MSPHRFSALFLLAAGLLISLSAATSPAGASSGLPGGMEAVTSVEGIHEYRMSNGLRVLLFPDPSKDMVTVNITYLVGSRHENYGEKGMAHLLEHLVFKGTPNHPNIPDELTAHGCRPNGTTWVDRTNYFETFAATEENLAWALDLEADRMVNSFIAKKDLDSEMTVVRNEFEVGENNPRRVLQERIESVAFLWHNYGRSTIGARSDIEKVPIERLQAFYRTWYQPDNAVLVVAGRFDEARTLSLIHDKFGQIPRPTRVLPETYTVEPAQDGERTVALRRVGDTQVLGAAYHTPAGSHPDFAALEILSFILGDSPSGRLYKALVEADRAASVDASVYQFMDPAILYVEAELRLDSSIEGARDIMIQVVEDSGSTLPSPKEVERARENLLKNWEVTLRHSERAARELSEWAAMGDWRLIFLHRDRLRRVTPEDVQRVAASYLRTSNRTLGMYTPSQESERTEIPPVADLAAYLGEYQGEEGLALGEGFDPTPENIEAHLLRSALPAGMKLSLLPKKTRGETVNLSLSLHFGSESSLENLARVGELTGSMLMRGTERRSRQEIRDELDRLRTQVHLGGGATGAWAGIETTRENLPATIRLAAEILKEPAFPASELELLKRERLLRLEESKSDPRQMAFNTLERHMKPWPRGDVRYVPTPEEEIEEIEAVTREQLGAFHADFYGVSAAELAVVGDFDPNEVEPLVAELFGEWRSSKPYVRLVSTYREIPPIRKSLEAPDKESAVFRAGLPIELQDEDPDYPAMVLGSFMTGGGFLNSRLATRIRQKDGLSYGVRSRFWASAWEKNAWFTAFAIYAPQNAERLETAFDEEIAAIVERGFTAEEIEEAKSGWLQSRRISRGQDRELASLLRDRDFEGRTLAWDRDLEREIAALTAEQILAAARRHLVPERISRVQAGDFAKAGKKVGEAGESAAR